jgi:hypothetical protein
VRVSGLTLIGARVVSGGDIVAGGWLATVVGCGVGVGGCARVGVGVAVGARTTDVLTVAGRTATGGGAGGGIGLGIAGDVAVGVAVGVDDGVASVGVTTCGAGCAG